MQVLVFGVAYPKKGQIDASFERKEAPSWGSSLSKAKLRLHSNPEMLHLRDLPPMKLQIPCLFERYPGLNSGQQSREVYHFDALGSRMLVRRVDCCRSICIEAPPLSIHLTMSAAVLY